jgi:hypothetical protein
LKGTYLKALIHSLELPMRFFLKLSLFASLLFSASTQASVWDDNQVWSLQYEDEFANWMQSPSVNEKMFTDSKSPYYGVSTDCADTSYALRAIFAFEHKLPFAIYSPSGSRNANKAFSNRQTSWDKLATNQQRLIRMINEIGMSVGTENLAHFDTFPAAIKRINPGTLFMYKIKARFGKFIRHSYNIKAINPVGTFDVIYSTQANKAKGLPLIRRKEIEFDHAPTEPFGFRKFKWPEHLGLAASLIPAELGSSTEQYTLVRSMGVNGFFKYVTKTLSSVNETTDERLVRLFKSVCNESIARIDYVNQGLAYSKETNNKCMNYEMFDAFSTPARDQSLKELFERLLRAYTEIQSSGEINNTPPELREFLEIIFKNKNVAHTELLAACPVAYRADTSIDLAILWKRISNEMLSSHPNDRAEARWGETSKNLTKCKRWY